MRQTKLVQGLLRSEEPSIRWRTRVRVLGESRTTPKVKRLEQAVRRSTRVRRLLSHRHAPFRAGASRNVYYYWQGIHWLLASLVDLGYPRNDPDVRPLVDRALALWLAPRYFRTFRATESVEAYRHGGVPVIRGRARRCGSQQGNALHYLTQLSPSDERSRALANLLLRWQWPDGGWNCDTTPSADTSSFMETLWPMRGLAMFADETGDQEARRAAERASEVFLERRLFRRRSDGKIIRPEFLKLHFPLYWHYDVLGGLKGLVEVGRIHDPRCSEALDWLEEKELPTGGWPAEARYYRVSRAFRSTSEFVNWGGVHRQRPNDWVTTDALFVLAESDRLAL